MKAGERLGTYEILAPLGAGGMGEVYRAKDLRLGREVAVKVLSSGIARGPEALSRFEREARVLAALSHPNVAVLHGLEETDGGDRFLVMELVEGETLDRRLERGALPVAEALELATQMARALEATHEKGIIHRDLKPSNVMINPRGEVKLLDFGLSKLLDEGPGSGADAHGETDLRTRTGTVMGTAPYMSPEQATGRGVDARTDVWSFGCVLYEMLSGRRPFEGGSVTETMAAILTQEPDWSRLPDETPEEVRKLLRRCVHKDARERLQSIGDARIELRELAAELGREGQPHTAPAPVSNAGAPGRLPDSGRPDHGLRALRRRRWPLTMAVAGILLIGAATIWYLGNSQVTDPRQGPGKIMLVVLPFSDLSPAADEDYFSDGLTEELSAHLGSLRPERLGVIGRTSAMRYKGFDKGIEQIGRELGVDYLLEGSVRRSQDRLRITAQLVQVRDQTHLWAESYESGIADIFALQNDIASRITKSLALELLPAGETAARKTVDPDAYDAYLKGWHFWHQLTPEAVEKSILQFQRAVELDPGYAEAHQGLAAAYHLQASGEMAPDLETYPKAKAAALTAIEIDPELADAHASLGFIAFLFDWDWAAAERSFRRALELNPGSTSAHHTYAIFLRAMGRNEESVSEMERAVETDPLSVLARLNLANSLSAVGRRMAALRQVEIARELEPKSPAPSYVEAKIELRTGRCEEAIRAVERYRALGGHERAEIATIYAGCGSPEEARSIAKRLRASASPGQRAAIYAVLGEREEALALLEQAYQERDDRLAWLKVDRQFDPLRDEPRFQDLMRRLDFPQ